MARMRHTVVQAIRFVLRPFGYLAFVVALAALSATATLLGERHALGYFAGRLSQMMWSYPEVTRRGVQAAWGAWAILFAIALMIDPLSTRWDEVVLAGVAAAAVWHHFFSAQRAGR